MPDNLRAACISRAEMCRIFLHCKEVVEYHTAFGHTTCEGQAVSCLSLYDHNMSCLLVPDASVIIRIPISELLDVPYPNLQVDLTP